MTIAKVAIATHPMTYKWQVYTPIPEPTLDTVDQAAIDEVRVKNIARQQIVSRASAVTGMFANPGSPAYFELFYGAENSDRAMWEAQAASLTPGTTAHTIAIDAYYWLQDRVEAGGNVGDANAHAINYYNWLKAYESGQTTEPIGKYYGF